METRSNRLVVGLVMGVLIAAAIGFALWLRPERDEEGLTYQIRFEQAVDGLRSGSGVNLLGVPVGRVTEIRLEPTNPGLVTVRFVMTQVVPLRRGVTASISRSLLDGAATISLEGGERGAPSLVAGPGQQFPVVPAKSGSLLGGELDPAGVVAGISSSSESVLKKLPADQRNIEERLAEIARRSRSWKMDADRLSEQLTRRGRFDASGRTIARVGEDAERLRLRLERSRPRIGDTLSRSLNDAERGAHAIGESISQARPRIGRLEDDIGRATETVRSARDPIRQVGDAARKIDREGLGSSDLPDYLRPAEDRR